MSSHVCAETRQEMLKRGSRFYVQAVCNSLSMTHSLSHTHTHTHTHTTRTGDMLERREHVLLSTPFARAVLQTSRERLNSSSGADCDAFFESSAWIQAPDHISRRRSKTSTQTLKKCKKQAHGLKAPWGGKTKSTWDMEWNRSKKEQIQQFESIQVCFARTPSSEMMCDFRPS
jgi:hypothetical protein